MEKLRYQIGLSLIKGIGPILAKNLIAYLGDVEAVFKEKQSTLAKIPDIGPVLSQQISNQQVLARADKEIKFIAKNQLQTFFYTDKSYPYRLKECADSPIMLYAKGNSNLNAKRFVGIVGTRDATEYGKANCIKLIQELAALTPELTIVSGLAYGIDICAHKTALESDLPTIGVIGHGLDRIYPATHRSTAIKMLEKGGLVTEYLTETNPDRQNFVQRNRLIAGMCDVIVVVESAAKGGSLITAEMAQSYNRDVYAFPGRVNDTQSAGCNALIKNNKAGLIENATDLVNAMCWEIANNEKAPIQSSLFIDLTEPQQAIVSLLRKEENASINQIALTLGLPISKTSSMLLEMEFGGIVKCLPGNVYKLRN